MTTEDLKLLGGGTNPPGTIISFYGPTAPYGYLVCDGATYNRADYPELANHLVTNFPDLVGDGSTTFKVPDLQGEFLRGAGTNSHSSQGSGGAVGVHQNSTSIPNGATDGNTKRYSMYAKTNAWSGTVENADSAVVTSYVYRLTGALETLSYNAGMSTLRPTNTSVLFCIKY